MWVLIGLLGLAAFLLLILAIPLEFTFSYRSQRESPAVFDLVWFFGLVKARLAKREASSRQKSAGRAAAKNAGGRRPDAGLLLGILRIKGITGHVKRFLAGILSSFEVERLTAEMRVSLDSPADTGTLFAFSAPFNYFFNTCSPWKITITPCFYNEAWLEAEITGAVRVVPLTLTGHVLRFLFAVPSLRAGVVVLKQWKRKK